MSGGAVQGVPPANAVSSLLLSAPKRRGSVGKKGKGKRGAGAAEAPGAAQAQAQDQAQDQARARARAQVPGVEVGAGAGAGAGAGVEEAGGQGEGARVPSGPLADWFQAARQLDQWSMRRILLEGEVRVDERDGHGRNALHMVSGGGCAACVNMLLEKAAAGAGGEGAVHALVNVADTEGFTPLHLAAGYGRGLCVDTLLRAGADPSARDAQKRTPLDLAQREAERCAYVEMSRGPNAGGGKGGDAKTMLSLRQANLGYVVQRLRGESASAGGPGASPLDAAATAAAAGPTLSTSGRASSEEQDRRIALREAARTGNLRLLGVALKDDKGGAATGKAELGVVFPGDTPWLEAVEALVTAAAGGHLGVLNRLIAAGAPLAGVSKETGFTALGAAACAGQLLCLRMLMKCGAEVTTRDRFGKGALDAALEAQRALASGVASRWAGSSSRSPEEHAKGVADCVAELQGEWRRLEERAAELESALLKDLAEPKEGKVQSTRSSSKKGAKTDRRSVLPKHGGGSDVGSSSSGTSGPPSCDVSSSGGDVGDALSIAMSENGWSAADGVLSETDGSESGGRRGDLPPSPGPHGDAHTHNLTYIAVDERGEWMQAGAKQGAKKSPPSPGRAGSKGGGRQAKVTRPDAEVAALAPLPSRNGMRRVGTTPNFATLTSPADFPALSGLRVGNAGAAAKVVGIAQAALPTPIPSVERARSLSSMVRREANTPSASLSSLAPATAAASAAATSGGGGSASLSQAASAEPYTPPTMIQLKASQAEVDHLRVVIADLKANIAAGAARESALAAEVGRLRSKLKAAPKTAGAHVDAREAINT